MKHLKWGILLTAMLVFAACSSDDDNNASDSGIVDDYTNSTDLIETFADDVAKTTYANLLTEAEDLETAVNTLVGTLSEANLESAQDAWRAARVYWEGSEGFLFGPVDSLGIDPAIDSWPLNKTDLDAVISGGTNCGTGTTSITESSVAALGNDVQGFHVVEYLLFDDGTGADEAGGSRDSADIVAALGDACRLDYLSAAAADLVSNITTLKNQSDTFYDDTFKTAGSGSTSYTSARGAIEEMLDGMIGIADEVGSGKISDPYNGNSGAGDTTKVESRYAYNSLTDFMNNTLSIWNSYWGTTDGFAGAPATYSLYSLYAGEYSDDATTLGNQIYTTYNAVLAIGDLDDDGTLDYDASDMPFRSAITDTDGRIRVQTAIDEFTTLLQQLETFKSRL